MKISIGANIIDGPWGGGNLFYKNLSNFLKINDIQVVYNLEHNDIDIILLTDPRYLSESSAYTHTDIALYKKLVNPKVVVVHRINECDERKGTKNLNNLIIKANNIADATVFVSNWLKELFFQLDFRNRATATVIYAGADKKIFNNKGIEKWNKAKKLKIVTHHWGTNNNKGFKIYQKLDQLLNNTEMKNRFEFTYIGNIPKNLVFRNTNIIKPLEGIDLSNELKKNNVYLTASLNEPSGNHHIEGAQCGLPLLYVDNGGVAEYCKGYGIPFSEKGDDFELCLEKMYSEFDSYFNKIIKYNKNSEKMCIEYLNLFNSLLHKKNFTNYSNRGLVFFKVYSRIKILLKRLITYDYF